MHKHWCEVEGHWWECSEDCVCTCGLPMEGNDHSECPVELIPCSEHQSTIRSSEVPSDESADDNVTVPDWFPTPEERKRFQEERRILRELVFYDLTFHNPDPENCDTAEFDEADFFKAVARCEILGFQIHGVDVFTKEMRYLGTVFGPEGSEDVSWCHDAVKKWLGQEGVIFSATYGVPDKFLGVF